jgi:hypothetical protein
MDQEQARLHVMGIRFPVDGEGDVHNGPRGVNEDIKSKEVTQAI